MTTGSFALILIFVAIASAAFVSDIDREENIGRMFPIDDILPSEPVKPENLKCPTGFYADCTKSRCRKPKSRNFQDEPIANAEAPEEEEEDATRVNNNMACTSSRTCPDGYNCQCTKAECVPIVGDVAAGSTGLPSCRCPCSTGPCPRPCVENAICTQQVCNPAPQCTRE